MQTGSGREPEWTDGWMDGQTDKWMDGRKTVRRTNNFVCPSQSHCAKNAQVP